MSTQTSIADSRYDCLLFISLKINSFKGISLYKFEILILSYMRSNIMENGHIEMSSDELYKEINDHLISDSIPSIYLEKVIERKEFQLPPFHLIYQLKLTEQSPIHHPEGNVWNHTLLVVNEAAKRKNLCKTPSAFMWAALLHDIGKPSTTKIRKGKITSYDHDKVGAKLAYDFLSQFTKDQFFINFVCSFIEFHMHILYVVNGLPYGNIPKLLKEMDVEEVALFGLCDRLGRKHATLEKEENTINQFIKRCKSLERK